MYCKSCGKDNFEGVSVCAGCGAEMPAAAPRPAQMPAMGAPKTSGLAIASLVLGILAFLTCGVTALPGLIVGIIAAVKINGSRGRLIGQGMAVAGIAVSGVALLLLPVMAAILFPVFARAREAARNARVPADCMSRAKALGSSVRMYIADYNGVYPPAAKWSDAVKPYNNKARLGDTVYRCPSVPDLACGYAVNGITGGQPAATFTSTKTILFFESDRGWNGYGGPEAMINQPRHQSFSLCCVDGHGVRCFPGYESKLRWSR